MTPTKLPVVILISGAGSNMQRLAELARNGELPIEVKAVISDRAAAPGLAIAANLGIPTTALSPKSFVDRTQFDAALADTIDSYGPQLIVLAGFMRILGPAFIQRFAGRVLNIHPSLLPKYPGLNTHQRALDAGDSEHGVSIHFVTDELDGGPLIAQARVPVLPGDNAATLTARVRHQEHQLYPQAVHWFATSRLQCVRGKALLDGQELTAPVQISTHDVSS